MVERLAQGECAAGVLGEIASTEFQVSQPAASRHLRVLRDAGLVRSRVDGARRIYSLEHDGIDEISQWADHLRSFWASALSALDTEIARGRRSAELAPKGESA
jgi:DNA-binding transcriptional ArsR family regulator